MKSFVIKEIGNNFEVISVNYNFNGFNYNFRNKNSLGVKDIVIVSPEIAEGLIISSFNKKYKKILEFYISIINPDDESEGNLIIALDEIARLRAIIINKYQNILKKNNAEKLLKKLKLLENEVRTKLIDFKLIKEQELVNTNVEESVKSR